MKAFLGFVLGVITVGVFLIAYGVLSPRVNAAAPMWGDPRLAVYQTYPGAPSALAGERVGYVGDVYAASGDRFATRSPIAYDDPRPVRTYQTYQAPRRTSTTRLERSSGRDWMKTALVIGGTSAAGAGVGAIFGGKKGALIGAAIGGGASSLYEARKR